MTADLGLKFDLDLETDSSAAKGVASRRGVGKIRHIEMNQLWLQEKVANKDVAVIKVKRNRESSRQHDEILRAEDDDDPSGEDWSGDRRR